jgi:hypothetical protein
MGLQAAVHLGHMPWALTKEEEEENPIIPITLHNMILLNVPQSLPVTPMLDKMSTISRLFRLNKCYQSSLVTVEFS